MTDLDIYAFKADGRDPSREGYLAAVATTAFHVLARATSVIGPPTSPGDWHGELIDFVNEVYLADNAAMREVFAFSPNLLKLRPADARDALGSAELDHTDEAFVETLLGQIAYRVFEQDLWDAVQKLIVERHGQDLWDAITKHSA